MSSPPTNSTTADLLKHATPDELALYEELLVTELAYQSPLDLAEYLRPGEVYRHKHTEYLNDIIVAFVDYRLYPSGPGPAPIWYYEEGGETYEVSSYEEIPVTADDFYAVHPETYENVCFRLAIAMPPRHGKSFIVTEHLPLWLWMRFPKEDIAFATYSDDFAAYWGAMLRDRMVEFDEKLPFTLKNGARSAAQKLDNTDGGRLFLVGTGGALTGRGYTVMGIIDDPFKDDTEAFSQAERNRKANWYQSVFVKRKTRHPGGRIPLEIMMFTRWHEDDLAGRYAYTEQGEPAPGWYVVRLPALAEENDPLGRAPGEALCPAIKTRRELEAERDEDPVIFAALNQGNPSLNESGLLGKMSYYKETRLPEDTRLLPDVLLSDCTLFASVDTAGTKSTWSDYSVFSVWAYHRQSETLFLRSVEREKMESVDLADWIERHARGYGVQFVAIEDKTFGQTAIQELHRRRKPFNVREIKADRDKVVRARPYGAAMHRGQVLFPESAPWLFDWEQEHRVFPLGKHDDQVDTGSIAWEVVNSWHALPEKKAPPPREVRFARRNARPRGGLQGTLGH